MWVWRRVVALLVSNGGGEYRDEQALRKQPSKYSEKERRSLFGSHGFFCCISTRSKGLWRWKRRKGNGGWNVWNKGEYIERVEGK